MVSFPWQWGRLYITGTHRIYVPVNGSFKPSSKSCHAYKAESWGQVQIKWGMGELFFALSLVLSPTPPWFFSLAKTSTLFVHMVVSRVRSILINLGHTTTVHIITIHTKMDTRSHIANRCRREGLPENPKKCFIKYYIPKPLPILIPCSL